MSKSVVRGCSFRGCGRQMRARGLCQTHYKQQLQGEALKPIALKRAKREGTMRYAGLSLTEACVSVIQERAKRMSLTGNAVITDILEKWAAGEPRKR